MQREARRNGVDTGANGEKQRRERTSTRAGSLGVLGLGVLSARLLYQLLLVLVLGLGVGGPLLRRDGPLMGEAIEDAEGQGRVPEYL